MTEEEMAKEYVDTLLNKGDTELDEFLNENLGGLKLNEKQAGTILGVIKGVGICSFLAGLKAGKPKWRKVADGDLPKENEYIMIYSKLADNIAVGKRRCPGKIRKRPVYEWYFATYEGTYCLKDKDIIAWKEIELPKEIKENERIAD